MVTVEMVRPGKTSSSLVEHWFTPLPHMDAESLTWTKHLNRMIISTKRSINSTEKYHNCPRTIDFNELAELFNFLVCCCLTHMTTKVGKDGVVPGHVCTNLNICQKLTFLWYFIWCCDNCCVVVLFLWTLCKDTRQAQHNCHAQK